MARTQMCVGVALAAAVALWSGEARATSYAKANLVRLVGESELILAGAVTGLRDGFDDRGVPYTEVTLEVSEAIRGSVGGLYTFRQFGLLAPRTVNGRRYLVRSPEGFPRFTLGEQVCLFLYRQASLTGLRTTTGLDQGKFTVTSGALVNAQQNEGLFDGVELDASVQTEDDRRVLETHRGPVQARTFMSLVRRAVKEDWVGKGRMRHAQR